MNKKVANFMLVFLAIVFGLSGGFLGLTYFKLPHNEILESEEKVYISKNHKTEISLNENTATGSGDVAVHFLELGNKYTGDCTYIKVGEDVDILIDCGSRTSSIAYVQKYLDNYIIDVADDGKKILDYVIVTHAHRDHYAGFATSTKMKSIFDLFYCNNIIYFSTTAEGKTDTSTYKNWARELSEAKGWENGGAVEANKYTALQCIEGTNGASKSFTLDASNNITLEILDHKYIHEADLDNENNNSVCCMINQGDKNFLFTGDLEGERNDSGKVDGEFSLIAKNDFSGNRKVELLKAGHHGSKTSSSTLFLDAVLSSNNPIVCVCCCAGSTEYTTAPQNTFPTKEFIERISQYTTLVYVTTLCEDYKNGKFTSFNGNITVISSGSNALVVKGSNNDTLLKDTDWFKENRYEMCYEGMAESWK